MPKLVLLLVLVIGCSVPVCNPGFSLVGSSTHYVYYGLPKDDFKLDTTWMELHYVWMAQLLDIDSFPRLEYYKYPDRNAIRKYTGRKTNGFAKVGSLDFHTIWHPEGHENAHTLVINLIGHPPALFNEGIAVALAPQPIYGKGNFVPTPTWGGLELDEIARRERNRANIPDLDKLLTSSDFFQFDTQITYPIAGSFCQYLIGNYGIRNFKSLISALSFEDTKGKVKSEFVNVYGLTIENEWASWLNEL